MQASNVCMSSGLHPGTKAYRRCYAANYNHRLLKAALYVTIEPCAMCAGAMIQARIGRLIYGAEEAKGGAVRSCFAIFEQPGLNHRVEVTAGVLAERAAAVLQNGRDARVTAPARSFMANSPLVNRPTNRQADPW